MPKNYNLAINPRPRTEARFWHFVDKNGPTSPHTGTPCWVWTGGMLREYGRFCEMPAHRWAFAFATRTSPDGMVVMHRCDTPSCVRPDHLALGTQADNMADMIHKGRKATGERCGSAKLNTVEVAEMRARRAAGETLVSLAAAYGVTHSHVAQVCLGRLWRDR